VRLVELEYERTAKFIDGVISTSVTVRGWAITIWLAVVGVALTSNAWELAILAALVVFVFAFIDAYHAWLYWEALRRANELERLAGAYYETLGRNAEDEDAEIDLRVRLESHRFGLYRNFKRFRLRDLRFARPPIFFRVFYPILILTAIGAAAWIAGRDKASPTCVVVEDSRPQAIQCEDRLIIGGKVVDVVPPQRPALPPTTSTRK
jgi:hypothetical protein